MSINVVRRKGLVSFIAILCLLPVRYPAAVFSEASQSAGCGPSMQGVDRLRADLELDNSLANRANSLAQSALRNGQAPPPDKTDALIEDSFDGLKDAGDQFVRATDEISKQLDPMNLPRQQRAWGQALDNMKKARTKIHYPTRQELTAGSTSAVGIGPKVMYEAAANFQKSAGEVVKIIGSDQGGWTNLSGPGIQNSQLDARTTPNPGPDPWQEWLKRVQAQMARIRNSVGGLNAAQALRAGDFQQAQQNVAEMQKAIQAAQGLADQLGQMVALCNQPVNQRPSQNNPPQNNPSTPPRGAQSGGTGGPAAASGGSNAGKLALAGLGAAAIVAGAAVMLSACKEPEFQSDLTACSTGNCSGCVAFGEKIVPWCDCLEQKHPEANGTSAGCRDYLAQIKQLKAAYRCEPLPNFTPVPVR